MALSKAELIIFLALIISLITLLMTPGGFLKIIGMGTTGEVKVNITESAALNVSRLLIDFGNGTIVTGLNNCTLASDRTGDPLTCFAPSWGNDGPSSGGFLVENIGNVALNVTVYSLKNYTSFWGVPNGRYFYKCNGNGTIDPVAANYIPFIGNGSAQPQNCTWGLPPNLGTDAFALEVNITIPPTAVGYKNDTVTITGVKA